MDFTLDVGNNLTTLGVIWLALKYLLPVLIGLAIIIIGIFALKKFLPDIDFTDSKQALLALIAAGIVVILIIGL